MPLRVRIRALAPAPAPEPAPAPAPAPASYYALRSSGLSHDAAAHCLRHGARPVRLGRRLAAIHALRAEEDHRRRGGGIW